VEVVRRVSQLVIGLREGVAGDALKERPLLREQRHGAVHEGDIVDPIDAERRVALVARIGSRPHNVLLPEPRPLKSKTGLAACLPVAVFRAGGLRR
jgi:hypothetical protein